MVPADTAMALVGFQTQATHADAAPLLICLKQAHGKNRGRTKIGGGRVRQRVKPNHG